MGRRLERFVCEVSGVSYNEVDEPSKHLLAQYVEVYVNRRAVKTSLGSVCRGV